LVPALIELLESGENARGHVHNYLAFSAGKEANLALLALSAVGPEASAAVPVILRIFPTREKGEQAEMLTCLALMGQAAKEGVATLQRAMKCDDAGLRLRGACALLNVTPESEAGAAMMKGALASKDKDVRKQALEICGEMAPPSKILVSALSSLL